MKAVFLDAGTFTIPLRTPDGVSDFECFDDTASTQIIERCFDKDIIITNKVVLDKQTIQALPNLKLIHISATGMNNVDIQACQARGVAVKNVAGYSTISVPEHTLMMILTAMRAGIHYHHQAHNGAWQAAGKYCLIDVPILDLAGRTLGIIGAGHLGTRVGELAKAFGMKVLYAERQGRLPRDERYSDFDTVLASADVISLHCALTEETHHLINRATIEKMHKTPLIVNMARGAIVKTKDIIWALETDKILGYATDVFEEEPPKDNELLSFYAHPRVFFTPHNAWGSAHAQGRLWQILCEQIGAFVAEFA